MMCSCALSRLLLDMAGILRQVPLPFQHRVLSWGILGAVVMRALFIALGEAAMSVFDPVLLAFAGILIFSSYKLWTEDDSGDEDLSDNGIVAFASKFLNASDSYDGDKFFTVVSLHSTLNPSRLVPVITCLNPSSAEMI